MRARRAFLLQIAVGEARAAVVWSWMGAGNDDLPMLLDTAVQQVLGLDVRWSPWEVDLVGLGVRRPSANQPGWTCRLLGRLPQVARGRCPAGARVGRRAWRTDAGVQSQSQWRALLWKNTATTCRGPSRDLDLVAEAARRGFLSRVEDFRALGDSCRDARLTPAQEQRLTAHVRQCPPWTTTLGISSRSSPLSSWSAY